MKTASIPPIRVTPELREQAESVLREGENLSGLVETALREQIRQRLARRAFISRGLAARDEARQSGEYFSAEDVLAELEG